MPKYESVASRGINYAGGPSTGHPSFSQASRLIELGALVLDLRPPLIFTSAFVPGSYSTSDSQCLQLACDIFGDKSIAIHAFGGSPDQIHHVEALFHASGRSITHFEELAVHSKAEQNEIARIDVIEPEQLAVRILGWKTTVIDLRDPSEFKAAHTRETLNLPIDNLDATVFGLPLNSPLTVVSDSSAFSAFGASILVKQGFRDVAILRDGFSQYRDRGLPLAKR